MLSLRALSVSAVFLGSVLVPAGAAAAPTWPVDGLTCGLASAAVPDPAGPAPRQAGVLSGGPVLVSDASLAVTYECTVVVVTPTVTTIAARERFETPGAVGFLPPTPVEFRADPARDRVSVCTWVEWFFPFPSGGAVDLGCQEAHVVAATGGYVATPGMTP